MELYNYKSEAQASGEGTQVYRSNDASTRQWTRKTWPKWMDLMKVTESLERGPTWLRIAMEMSFRETWKPL
ncbi:hypothetical protein Tco_1218753 [Tanacetum coccineum]